MIPPKKTRWLVPVLLSAAIVLSACGGGGHEDDHHHDDEYHVDTAGRLVIAESGAASVSVYDLDSNEVHATHTLTSPASALYTSPGGRYAVALQQNQDVVQFVDGGIWQEDHGDHMHDYKRDSNMMAWTLTGPRPTHFDVQPGNQAAIFMDGRGDAVPPQYSAVRVISDASIASGAVVAGLELDYAVHGLAEPRNDVLLVAFRAPDAPDALPTHLNVFRRSGANYTFESQLPTRCERMHGSYGSGNYTAAGCADGVLLATHGASGPTSGKVATPIRVSTIAGHPLQPDGFIAIGNDGAGASATTRFFTIDAAAGTSAEFTPTGWTTGTLRRAHGFDHSGQTFFILDSAGDLHAMRISGGAWTTAGKIAAAIPTMPAAAPFPSLTVNAATDEVYLSDPVAHQVVVIDSQSLQVKRRIDLGFSPSYLAWVGIAR